MADGLDAIGHICKHTRPIRHHIWFASFQHKTHSSSFRLWLTVNLQQMKKFTWNSLGSGLMCGSCHYRFKHQRLVHFIIFQPKNERSWAFRFCFRNDQLISFRPTFVCQAIDTGDIFHLLVLRFLSNEIIADLFEKLLKAFNFVFFTSIFYFF